MSCSSVETTVKSPKYSLVAGRTRGRSFSPCSTISLTIFWLSSTSFIKRLSEDIQPGLFENLTDKQIEIIDKYGDLVDRELLKNIVLDPDPNNQAAALATLDEVKTLMDKGMSTDEIMNVLQATPRRKQAEGGLSYLMGM